ncbi:uncharacterized protein LOC121253515 [Juglans microcarpa x Juglans regia]|uniref:uncharacterized protein LOC121253515 n=1 Tax=Juglans microcarpa x Juglans regia TaxID=2249226 RepID=UPI001B7F1ABB|nr:uncharacterized protein LOC121253515 [Juglans microcarpa x Juglans regia]
MVSEGSSPTRTETSSNSMLSSDNSLVPNGSNSACTLPLVTINTSNQLPYKLTSSNYPFWRATFLTILIGYDLMKYLDGTFRCPPTHTVNSSASAHLARLFATKSWAWIKQLKEDLTLIQRGSRTVSVFLHAVKVIADELSLIDAPVSDDDLTLYVLNDLGSEF